MGRLRRARDEGTVPLLFVTCRPGMSRTEIMDKDICSETPPDTDDPRAVDLAGLMLNRVDHDELMSHNYTST